MYLHQLFSLVQGANERNILNPNLPNGIGAAYVMEWDIRDGPDNKANLVGCAQGLSVKAGVISGSWLNSLNMVFTDERFKGSILQVQLYALNGKGEGAVLGGTGKFAYAQGIVTYKWIKNCNTGRVMEFHIRVVCLTFPKPNPIQKLGPWGGYGGTAHELQEAELPRRLESVTVHADDVVKSIGFSYIDRAGKKHTAGIDCMSGPQDQHIKFGASETVKEIYGATGNFGGQTVVTSLTIVTNVTNYGPYGKHVRGNTLFHTAAPDNHSIVGFYGNIGEVLNKIGVYVGPD